MAENENEIVLSPQETEEVDRILNRLSIETILSDDSTAMNLPVNLGRSNMQDDTDDQDLLSEFNENIILDKSDTEDIEEEETEDFAATTEEEDEEQLTDISDQIELSEEIDYPEKVNVDEETIEEPSDISDLIHEIEIPSEESSELISDLDIEDIGEPQPELSEEEIPESADEQISEITDDLDIESLPDTEEAPEAAEEFFNQEASPLPSEETDIEEFPEDLNLISDTVSDSFQEPDINLEEIPDSPDFPEESGGTKEVQIEDTGSGDFDDITKELEKELDLGMLDEPDAQAEPASQEVADDIPSPVFDAGEINLDETESLFEEKSSLKTPNEQENTDTDDLLSDLSNFTSEEPEPHKNSEAVFQTIEPESGSDLTDDILEPELNIDFDKLEQQNKAASPVDDTYDKSDRKKSSEASISGKHTENIEEDIELTENDLKKLKKVFHLLHPNLTAIIKDVVVNNLLPAKDIRKIIDMLMDRDEQGVKNFLEKKLNKKINTSSDEGSKRKVIVSRPIYTKEGRERQAFLLRATKRIAIAFFAAFLATILSYQYIYKPVMAKRKIELGAKLIKKPGVPLTEKQRDYKEAEDLFQLVDKNYRKDYLYGYNTYAKAYMVKKEYPRALNKLNKAYQINEKNINTLNNLGYLYSKLPEAEFERVKPELGRLYFTGSKPDGFSDRQVDVSIEFYNRTLRLDAKNITAKYGIGKAYMSLGQSQKAREYFTSILKDDKDSLIGYSGLLNLYIETDSFKNVIAVHSEIHNKEKLPSLPSPLLAKLASYYLSKSRTPEENIRINYGITNPEIKDTNDNPYPAVRGVLNALAERDINYPPLLLLFAKLAEKEKNLTLMKRNLEDALEKNPGYFATNLLLGKYNYLINNPSEAYNYCKEAIKTYSSQPEFTEEEFFHETENIGQAYAILGDIFYFMDNKTYRFGDEFDEAGAEAEMDKFYNYTLAMDKYEKALAENFKSEGIYYNLGRVYYIKENYEKAAETWMNLYNDFIAKPELMFALGNAFYHQNNYEAGKGEYLKAISIFEEEENKISVVDLNIKEHKKVYKMLSAAYNNLGAIYQHQNSESKSNISYLRSVQYAKRIDEENEYARVNMNRSFRPGRENVMPILDESLPEKIEF